MPLIYNYNSFYFFCQALYLKNFKPFCLRIFINISYTKLVMNLEHKKNLNTLVDIFKSGIKKDKKGLLGVEIEHFLIDKDTLATIPYGGNIGVEKILTELAKFYNTKEFSQGHLIALSRPHILVSLEPAGQLEVSIGEFLHISDIKAQYDKFFNEIKPILDKHSLLLYTRGYHHVSKASDMPLLPKERYRLMDNHFKTSGTDGLYMMRGTAATHVAIDYFSEKDFVDKFRLANLLSPLFVYLTSSAYNFEGKKNTNQMLRHKIWSNVDNARCLIAPNVNSFLDYAKYVYSTPPIFLPDGDNAIGTGNKTFAEIITDGELTDDLAHHALSMVFPYVRLKSFIEIRTADSMFLTFTLGYLALIKGIFYNTNAIQELLTFLKGATDSDIYAAFNSLEKHGYKATVYGTNAIVFYEKLFGLAYDSIDSKPGDTLQIDSLIELEKLIKNKVNI